MRDIASLRQARAAAYQQLTALQAAAGDRAMTAEEQAAFDAQAAAVEGLDSQIRTAERIQGLVASTAIPSPASAAAAVPTVEAEAAGGAAPRTYPQAATPVAKGIKFSQTVRALVSARGNIEAAREFAASTWGENYDVTAGLQANDASAGGFLVPEQFSAEMIELVRPRTVVRKNCRVVPLVGGTDTMPTVESGSAAYYIGEGSDIQETEPTFGSLKFVEREVAALVPISNKLLRNASVNVDVTVRDDLTLAFAQAEDVAFLRSNGVGAAPKGIRYLAGSIIAANASVSLANIDADSRKLINGLALNNIPMINPRWVMSPRVFGFLQDLRDGNGNIVFPGLQLAQPMWKSFPVEVTNNVPVNLGGGGTDSELSLVDFNEAVIADTFQVRIDASESASYKKGGVMVSAYSQNQTVIRAVAAHDFGLRRAYAAAVLTGVSWGA
ncbi:MAG TPA: phage major capsid protein [Caulobacteraceae bacterium]|jgi:HK97 family phage major capsid protein|nr:phage major capsid protein [Caulobacteraceae bacterium]